MKENVLRKKSLTFAVRIVNLSKYLRENKKEFTLSDQVLRSGTAIGAMICEAERSESTPDFIHKLKIAEKEANEKRKNEAAAKAAEAAAAATAAQAEGEAAAEQPQETEA